ncbi:MAG TPA: hypothetical protein DCR04_12925 [Flavobacteriales bacterium]|nr:hypothetical protein [Flavobacteriales bacterium]
MALFLTTVLYACKTPNITKKDNHQCTDARFYFKSTFEGNIQITPPTTGKNGKWGQHIIGTDAKTGAKWPYDLPGNNDKSMFIYLISEKEDPSTVVETSIVTTKGYDGRKTQTLYQEVKKGVKNQDAKLARNQLNLINDPESMFQDIRVSYKMKLQENLESVMPKNSWRQITEIRGVNNSYRIGLYINRRKTGGPLFWKIQGQQGPEWKKQRPDWIQTTLNETRKKNEIEIPLGEWFRIEFHLVSDKNGNGQFVCTINDKRLINQVGKVSTQKGFISWHIFKTYASLNALNAGAHYQWIDDVEIEVRNP